MPLLMIALKMHIEFIFKTMYPIFFEEEGAAEV